MGKLKLRTKFDYPLPPNDIEFTIKLVGNSIKIINDDAHEIKIKGIDVYERRRNIDKVKIAMELINDNLVFVK